MDQSHPIILFDGICNLCNRSVQFLLKKDRKNQFLFASLQSPPGQAILKDHGLSQEHYNSFILLEDGIIYTRSTAVLRVFKRLGGIRSWLYIFIVLPRPVRDALYDYVARNRYKWFGTRAECWVPTPELKSRFLE